MLTVFWICFLIGVLYTLVVVIVGDVIAGALDATFEWMHVDAAPYIQPLTLMGGLTIFGGAGILLTKFTAFSSFLIISISIAIAVVGIVLLYFFYIKPMDQAETSTALTMNDYVGREAEALTTIPNSGYGEIMVKTINGMSNHTASSYNQQEIPLGSKVVVVEIEDGVMLVAEIQI